MTNPRNQSDLVFTEQVRPSLAALSPALLLVPAIWLVAAPFNQQIGLLIGIALAAIFIGLRVFNSATIQVSKDQLQVGRAIIARKFITSVDLIEKKDQFAARGPQLDARAFAMFQSSAKGLLRVNISDKADPTPYWLVSTNRAAELQSILNTKKQK